MALTVLKTILFSLRSHGHVWRFLTCGVAVLVVLLAMFSSIGVAWYREFRQLNGPPATTTRSVVNEPRSVPASPVGLRCRQLRSFMSTRLGAAARAIRWHYVADTHNGGAWQVVANGSEYLWIDMHWLALQNSETAYLAEGSATPAADNSEAGHPEGEGSIPVPTVSPVTGMAAMAASPMFRGCDSARLQELVANGMGFGRFRMDPADLSLRDSAPLEEDPPAQSEPPAVPQPADSSFGLLQPRTGTVSARANLRAGPNLNFAVRGVVDAGTEIVVVHRSIDGQWLKTEDGSWIHQSLVVLDPQVEGDP
ncbi:MAG: SH3 domain-containing protein [Caldilineaceae bacterium SB0665_bin_21]|nr:SH3 domain-containing protein [Caldilineaceae bacterium SB0665_bin_21]